MHCFNKNSHFLNLDKQVRVQINNEGSNVQWCTTAAIQVPSLYDIDTKITQTLLYAVCNITEGFHHMLHILFFN